MVAAAAFLLLASVHAAEGPRVVILGAGGAVRRCYAAAASADAGDHAIEVCDLAIDRADASGRRRDRAASVVNRGIVRYHRGEYRLAVADYTRAIDRYGMATPDVLVNRALSYEAWAPGDPTTDALARADYERALAARPDNAVAKRRLRELGKPFLERAPVERTVVARDLGESRLTRRAGGA